MNNDGCCKQCWLLLLFIFLSALKFPDVRLKLAAESSRVHRTNTHTYPQRPDLSSQGQGEDRLARRKSLGNILVYSSKKTEKKLMSQRLYPYQAIKSLHPLPCGDHTEASGLLFTKHQSGIRVGYL